MVYYPRKDYDLPSIDLLTLVYESPLAWLQEDQVAHAEAAEPRNCITKAQSRIVTRRLIHVLRNQFNIGTSGPGKDVVVCMSSGQILLPNVFYAVIGAGGVFSAASSSFSAGELIRQIKQGSSNLLVVSEDCAEVAIQAAKECGIPHENVLILQSMGGKRLLHDVSGKGKNYLEETAELGWEKVTAHRILKERPICLLYSSGTTGPPKGVHVSHLNMVSEGLILQLMNREYFERQKQQDPSFNHQYRILAHLPVAHIAGCIGYYVNPSIAGGPVYWMPKFDFPKFLEYSKKFEISSLFTVPPIYLLIAKSPLVSDHFAHIEQAATGAAPIGPELKMLAEQRMGCKIGQTWGLSETMGSVTFMPWGEHDETGGISPVLPNCRMRIVGDDERDVPEGEEGEFLVQGPNVTQGYWKNEAATQEGFTKDGKWLKTGDIGVRKNDKFYVVDRKKEMIKYKGLQVAPAELEALLLSHALIQDAAVIGIPDPTGSGNELPRAYVVVGEGGDGDTASNKITADEIKALVKNNLASHKQLRGGVVFLDVIPKSPSGKILRRVLRDMEKAKRKVNGAAKL